MWARLPAGVAVVKSLTRSAALCYNPGPAPLVPGFYDLSRLAQRENWRS